MLFEISRIVKIVDFGVVRVEVQNLRDMIGVIGIIGYMVLEVFMYLYIEIEQGRDDDK